MITIIKNGCIALFAFLVTLLGCELFIRNSKIADVSFAEFYEGLGKGMVKDQTFVQFNEGFGILKTNNDGFIGQQRSQVKPENTFRIALMGDSYIEALQIFERDHFGNILEQNLNAKFTDRTIEVLNFGRANFNFVNQYAYQKLFVDDFEPDLLLYFLSEDDLLTDDQAPSLLPSIKIEGNQIVPFVQTSPQEIEKYQRSKLFTQNSVVINLINSGRHRVRENQWTSLVFGKFYSLFSSEKKKTKLDFQLEEKTKRIIEAIQPKKSIIINRTLSPFPEEFQEVCSQQKLTQIPMNEMLLKSKLKGENPEYWSVSKEEGHWNPKAHLQIGKYLSGELTDIINDY